jgi:dual specificity tyrosine-phosphorylation-regulated kinase 1
MVPSVMLEQTDDQHRIHFFEQRQGKWTIKQTADGSPLPPSSSPVAPSSDPITSLKFVVSKEANQKKKFSQQDSDQTARSYDRFVDLIYRMLAFNPRERITPTQALEHPFIANQDLG